jgi:transposase InsO family protein
MSGRARCGWSRRPASRLGDGTEFVTGEGKQYVASVQDVASRRVLGFSLSEHHSAELAYGTLAVTVRGGAVPGVIMHTDQGSEYTVRLFRVACERLPIRQSMGQPGSPHKRDDRVPAFHRGMGAAVQGHLRDQCPDTDGDRGADRGLQHHAAALGLRHDAPGRLGAGLRHR